MTIRLIFCVGLLCFTLASIAAGILSPVGMINIVISHFGSDTDLQTGAAHGKIDSQTPTVSNDRYAANQWALNRVHIPVAWTIRPHNEVVVAVLDTGIDTKH